MAKCKKLLVMILGVVCVIALSLGLAACGGGDGETYTVTVTDTTEAKNPVANVWIEFFYTETRIIGADDDVEASEIGKEYTYQEKLTTAKTDQNGVAKFISSNKAKENLTAGEFNPLNNVKYMVKIAANGATTEEKALPYNYALHTETDKTTQLPITEFEFDENRNAALTLDYLPNHFYYSERPEHPYHRAFIYKGGDPWYEPEFKESEDNVLQLDVKAGRLNYFDFSPFINTATLKAGDINPVTGLPYTEEEAAEIAPSIPYLATLAATGKYKISIATSTPGATPVMRQFFANTGFAPLNANGEPMEILAITGNGASGLFTGTNYIELDLDATKSAAGYYFYVTSTVDCSVTITVERTGEATEQKEIDTINVQPTVDDPPFFARENNLTPVPVDGSVKAVLGDDGFYHINSKDGRIIAVMLTKTDIVGDRIGDAINTWKNLTKTDVENNVIYNYSTLINFYSFFANDDGVYGLNEDLYNFAVAFADGFAGASTTDRENNWLLPCVYYAEDNEPISAGAPFNMVYEGENLAYSLIVQEDGWFIFDLDSMPEAIESIKINGNPVYSDYDKNCVKFKAEAGKKLNVEICFNENEAIHGDTYAVTLSETEGSTFTTGENSVELDHNTVTTLAFKSDKADGSYTVSVKLPMNTQGYKYTVTVRVGDGADAATYTFNEANNYTVSGIRIASGTNVSISADFPKGVFGTATVTITAE